MIDPNDKQTAALPMEEQPVKRRRGRPATGKAMTPAQKQKAYRERLKTRKINTKDTKDTQDLAYLLENLKRILDQPTRNEKIAALEGFGVIIDRMIRDRE